MELEEHKELWNRRESILYRAELSSSYHRKREQFFTLADRWDKIATLVLGTAVFAQMVPDSARQWLAVVFAALACAALVFDFGERARKHSDLATRFKLLESDIESKGQRDFEEENLNQWASRLCEVEASEPPTYCALIRVCQNEIARARNQISDIYPIKWNHRFFAHVWPFSGSAIK